MIIDRCLVQSIFVIFWLVTCPFYGQGLPKRMLTANDYHLWGKLYNDKISDKGQWVSFAMRYDSHPDTLFVSSTDGKNQYSFENASNGTFFGEDRFAVWSGDTLKVLDLQTSKMKIRFGVTQFSYAPTNQYLLTLEQEKNKTNLKIIDANGNSVREIQDVVNYSLSPTGNEVIYTQTTLAATKVSMLSLIKVSESRVIMKDAPGNVDVFAWQKSGESVAFLFQQEQDGTLPIRKLGFLKGTTSQTKFFDLKLPTGTHLADASKSRLTVSDDGKKILFGIEPIEKQPYLPLDAVQVWNGNDKILYPERKKNEAWKGVPQMGAWWHSENKFTVIGTPDQPNIFFNGNQEYAITYNLESPESLYNLTNDANYYVTDLKNGQTHLCLKGQSTEYNDLSISPQGKYIAYYREGSYWIYSFLEKKHLKLLTPEIKLNAKDQSGLPDNFGIAGWGINDASLLFYDEYDIWCIDFHTGKTARLTTGKENETTFRVAKISHDDGRTTFTRRNADLIDVRKSILLKGSREIENGYVFLHPNGKYTFLDKGIVAMSGIMKALKSETYIYNTQRYDKSPDIRSVNPNKKPQIIYESNRCDSLFHWGRNELIQYKNAAGIPLKAILYYPANYDPSKKYPMIVSIYEILSSTINLYENPSKFNMIGFNISNLTTKGYFVLRPDMLHQEDNPGISAADCTIAATKEVIAKGIVDPAKIGLIGHSFGGYETNFIITQTNLFAAAISGAGIADVPGHYLSLAWNLGKPEIFRYENQQWRMRKNLFEDWESYERNSPIRHTENIKTPLLLWTGEDDRQVNYDQSISYYIALRRLKKEQMLLIYPKERHVLLIKQNQLDLTNRVEDWFGYYLKGEHPQQWIAEGIK